MYLIDAFSYVVELNVTFKFRLRKRRKARSSKRKGEGAKAPPRTFEGTLQKYKQNEQYPRNTQEKTRGGARRPRTIAKQITIGIPQDALEIFQQQPNKNAFITAAIRHYAAFLAGEEG